jgi:hypothetical protein
MKLVTLTFAFALVNFSLGVTHAQDWSRSSTLDSLATSVIGPLSRGPASSAEKSAEFVEAEAGSGMVGTAITGNSSNATVSESSAEAATKLCPSVALRPGGWASCWCDCIDCSWKDILALAACCVGGGVACPWCVATYGTVGSLCAALCLVYS